MRPIESPVWRQMCFRQIESPVWPEIFGKGIVNKYPLDSTECIFDKELKKIEYLSQAQKAVK